MEPILRKWPSEFFYQGQILDGESVTKGRRCLFDGPSRQLHVLSEAKSRRVGSSYCNDFEVNRIVDLVAKIDLKTVTVGVITFYSAQKSLLQSKLPAQVTIATVDGFQGGEKDVIFVSFCREKASSFLNDPKRINVAVTRARFGLILVTSFGIAPEDPLKNLLESFNDDSVDDLTKLVSKLNV